MKYYIFEVNKAQSAWDVINVKKLLEFACFSNLLWDKFKLPNATKVIIMVALKMNVSSLP